MQTINDAAKSVYKESTTHDEEVAFKRGVEFAQQWISIEAELPENDERVLTKFENGKVIVNSYDINLGKWQYEFDKKYTHWRPISFL